MAGEWETDSTLAFILMHLHPVGNFFPFPFAKDTEKNHGLREQAEGLRCHLQLPSQDHDDGSEHKGSKGGWDSGKGVKGRAGGG